MPLVYGFTNEYNTLNDYHFTESFTESFTKEERERLFLGLDVIPEDIGTTQGASPLLNSTVMRSSTIKWIHPQNRWEWLFDKLMHMVQTANSKLWKFDLHTAAEPIQYTEYHASKGGHYTWHQDIGAGMASLRKISITVQLSDPSEYEGGDLQIWAGGNEPYTAPKGQDTVVIFPSYMLHRVTKVTSGVRKSLVLWVGGDHYR